MFKETENGQTLYCLACEREAQLKNNSSLAEHTCGKDNIIGHIGGGAGISRKNLPSWKKNIIEQLAKIEHQRWADWQKYCHKVLRENLLYNVFLEVILNRWDKQIETPYSQLSEKEKDRDREQVMRYWPIIEKIIQSERDKVISYIGQDQGWE